MAIRTSTAALAAAVTFALGTLPAVGATAHAAVTAPPASAHDAPSAAGHDHGTAAHGGLTLDHGRKWATDQPLRDNMDAIRALMAPRIAAIHAGTVDAAEYQALGGKVEARVADIVANCKLSPDADAVLHVVVADLLAGADDMKAGTHAAAGAHKVVTAANAYAEHFDHPGWQPLR